MLHTRLDPHRPSFAELFTPKLITVLRRGYGLPQLQADVIAGLTVAIVALPLSMAIAIASGAPPERGLYTAIVGGLPDLGLGRQPLSGRRPGRRLHRPGGGQHRAARVRRVSPRDHAGRVHPHRHRLSAPRLLHPIHPASGDHRFHGRDRRHHHGEPAPRPLRHDASGTRAVGARAQACRPYGAPFPPSIPPRSRWRSGRSRRSSLFGVCGRPGRSS